MIDIFRGIFESYPDGVLLVDAEGKVVLANGAAAGLLGYSRETLQGLAVESLVPDSVAPRHAALRHGYAQAPKTRPMGTDLELNAKRADGSWEVNLPSVGIQGGWTALAVLALLNAGVPATDPVVN